MDNCNQDFINTLISGFEYYGYNVSTEQIDKLALFNKLVMETNEHTNLTAIANGAESAKKHFLDSVNPAIMKLLKAAKNVIDVGSGAGFPGIPFAILNNDINFTLVDTRKKRCEFMEYAKSALNLNNVKIVWKRAEELGQDINYREKYDIACARALAAMPTLLEYLVPFVKIDGYVILYKGKSYQDEIDAAQNAIKTLGIENVQTLPYTIFDESSQFRIIYGKKLRPTPIKYPRKVGLPAKRPL